MRILLDMDDVLEQLVKGWVQYLNEKYGTDVKESDITSWSFAENFPTLTEEEVYGAENDDHLWDYVTAMPDGPKYVKKLMDEGHEVYVVTNSSYTTLKKKMEDVLFRYYPFLDFNHVIITANKHMVQGDVLVDDYYRNLAGAPYRKILFESRHNIGIDEKEFGAVRVHNWKEAYDELQKIAREMGE